MLICIQTYMYELTLYNKYVYTYQYKKYIYIYIQINILKHNIL